MYLLFVHTYDRMVGGRGLKQVQYSLSKRNVESFIPPGSSGDFREKSCAFLVNFM